MVRRRPQPPFGRHSALTILGVRRRSRRLTITTSKPSSTARVSPEVRHPETSPGTVRSGPQAARTLPKGLEPWIEGLAVRLGTPANASLPFVGLAACDDSAGTTTIARAVAHQIHAGLGRRVLLVDANFKTPGLHREFGLPLGPGLSDLLAGLTTLRQAVQTADGSGLCVLTAGTPSLASLSLFTGPAFETMKGHLREYFDNIIFDCAPLSRDAETYVLAKKLDGLVMVLAAERTRWESGAQIIERLRSADVNVVGAVINGKKFHIPNFIYRWL
jgi:Mrp family chromosome partitioning ATPase